MNVSSAKPSHLAKLYRWLSLAVAVIYLGLASTPVRAQTNAQAAIEDFVRQQTQGLPGRVSFNVGELDPRTRVGPCEAFEPSLPTGSRLWGKATVGLRCLGPSSWTIYVPVQVIVSGNYLVTARPMAPGYVIGDTDIAVRSGDLSALPPTVITDIAQASGRTVKNGLASGQVLRSDQLAADWVILQGQNVRIVTNGPGFSVSSEGVAINNAAAGQVVQVRTNGGKTLRGIAGADRKVELPR